jgi:2'-5' RNA ligase
LEKLRCFIAIDLPTDLKEVLAGIQQQLNGWPAKVKWVEKHNLHLTLKFLGDIDALKVDEINKQLEIIGTNTKAFDVCLNGLGAFPSTRNPKVIWAGVKTTGNNLSSLWSAVEKGMLSLGFSPEAKPFSPHLTLGRVKDQMPVSGFAELLAKVELKDFVIPVNEIKLMKSILSRSGPEYTCLKTVGFQ